MGERHHCPLVSGDTRSLWSEDTTTPHAACHLPKIAPGITPDSCKRGTKNAVPAKNQSHSRHGTGRLLKNLGWARCEQQRRRSRLSHSMRKFVYGHSTQGEPELQKEQEGTRLTPVGYFSVMLKEEVSTFMGIHTRQCFFSFSRTFLILLKI